MGAGQAVAVPQMGWGGSTVLSVGVCGCWMLLCFLWLQGSTGCSVTSECEQVKEMQ